MNNWGILERGGELVNPNCFGYDTRHYGNFFTLRNHHFWSIYVISLLLGLRGGSHCSQ